MCLIIACGIDALSRLFLDSSLVALVVVGGGEAEWAVESNMAVVGVVEWLWLRVGPGDE